jgi:hypothetical protein
MGRAGSRTQRRREAPTHAQHQARRLPVTGIGSPRRSMNDAGFQWALPHALRIRHDALRGVAAAERLLLLDDLWTTYVERASREQVRGDLSDIELLVGDLRSTLTELRDVAVAIRPVLESVDDDAVDRAVNEALSGNPEGEELGSFLRETSEPEGLRGAMLAAADHIVSDAELEATMLEEQLTSLRTDGEASGDIRLSMKCATYLLKTACYIVGTGLLGVAAGIANPLVLGGTLAVEAGIVIDAIKGWKESDCRRYRPQPAPT